MAISTETLELKLQHLPTKPGDYLFKDGAGEIIYIGKAKSLSARVRSYFTRGQDHSPKTRELVRRIEGLEPVVVGSEVEALLLESNLIKTHPPWFDLQSRHGQTNAYT